MPTLSRDIVKTNFREGFRFGGGVEMNLIVFLIVFFDFVFCILIVFS